MAPPRGFTLLELLFTVFVAITITVIAVPNLQTLVLNSQRTANINAFVRAVHIARNEAIKQSRPMTLCKSGDGLTCGPGFITWTKGWIIRAEPIRGLPLRLVFTHTPEQDKVTIRGNRNKFVFHPFHRRQTNGTLVFCDRRGPKSAKAVIVSYTGRPRVSEKAANGGALPCLSP